MFGYLLLIITIGALTIAIVGWANRPHHNFSTKCCRHPSNWVATGVRPEGVVPFITEGKCKVCGRLGYQRYAYDFDLYEYETDEEYLQRTGVHID